MLRMEFTRHAKNRMRLYNVTPADAEAVVATPAIAHDVKENPIHAAVIADGRMIEVVVALNEPSLVITLYEKS